MRRSLLLRGLIAITMLACAGGRTGGQVTGPPRPAWLRACVLSSEPALCGNLTVAESPGDPATRTLDLDVIVVPARKAAPHTDPIVLLTGGPGQGAAELAEQLATRIGVLRDDYDLILVDQRGTGSSGLHCARPADVRDLMGRIFDPERLAACRADMAQRADLTRYTTTASAADYERLLDALAVQRVNVWGVSYGTRLGFELARRLPNRVRTLILESVVPVTFTWPTSGATDLEAALNLVIRDCAADTACFNRYPRLSDDVDASFTRLRQSARVADVVDPATGAAARVSFSADDLAYAVRGLLYGDAARLPGLFESAARGDYSGFAQAYVSRARTLDQQIADGVLFGVYCAEDLPFVDWPAAQHAAAETRIGTYLLDQYRQACAVWPRGAIPADFRTATPLDVPALLFSGRRDPVTPPHTGEDVARLLPHSRHLIWTYGGHGIDAASATCRNRIIGEFLGSADAAVADVSCMNR